MIRILTYSTLFPNNKQPNHGIFVETRLRHLIATGQVESKVVAPIPWFPSDNSRFGRYASYARIPAMEKRNGFEIYHPKYLVIPKVGMTVSPLLLALASLPTLRKLRKEYDFQLIDAHYFFPDGVAAALLAKWLNIPMFITARGSDINLIPKYVLPRKMIQWAAGRAEAIITVSEALKSRVCALGVSSEKITTLRNGVDLGLFVPPQDRSATRTKLGMAGTIFLSVGNLVELKGHELLINMMPFFPKAQLIIIGSGPERDKLLKKADREGVKKRVKIVEAIPQKNLVEYYGAADCLLLASSREGWPNVLLEAMACGTPVVATDVGGVSEIVGASAAGVIVRKRSVEDFVEAVSFLLRNYPDRKLTRYFAEEYSWKETSANQIKFFSTVLS